MKTECKIEIGAVNSPLNLHRFQDLRISMFSSRYLRLIKDIAWFCHPIEKRKSIRLFTRSLYWAPYSIPWFQQITRSAILSKLVKKDKNLVEKLHRRLLRMDYPIERRYRILSEHYIVVERLMSPKLLQQILLENGLMLSRIEISPEQNFDLVLGYGGYPGKEGELAITMRQSADNYDLARLTFSFILTPEGYSIYIGGLQGLRGARSREIVSHASKACHGLSPKRIVMEALYAMAKLYGVRAILGISDEQHVSRKKQNKYFSYDVYWLELNAIRNKEGDYLLPSALIHKEKQDVPTKRRAKYRRQHVLLSAVTRDTLNALEIREAGYSDQSILTGSIAV